MLDWVLSLWLDHLSETLFVLSVTSLKHILGTSDCTAFFKSCNTCDCLNYLLETIKVNESFIKPGVLYSFGLKTGLTHSGFLSTKNILLTWDHLQTSLCRVLFQTIFWHRNRETGRNPNSAFSFEFNWGFFVCFFFLLSVIQSVIAHSLVAVSVYIHC